MRSAELIRGIPSFWEFSVQFSIVLSEEKREGLLYSSLWRLR